MRKPTQPIKLPLHLHHALLRPHDSPFPDPVALSRILPTLLAGKGRGGGKARELPHIPDSTKSYLYPNQRVQSFLCIDLDETAWLVFGLV